MSRYSRWLLLGCLAATALGLFMFFWPVQTTRSRVLVVGCLIFGAIGWPLVMWRRRGIRRAMLALEVIVLVLFFGLPNRPTGRTAALRESYQSQLQRYMGLDYVWGGETEFGVDCSGLVRRAMIRACWSEGLRRMDGGLLRMATDLWLHDCSANAIGDGYRGLTQPVTQSSSLNAADATQFQPGDMAVVADGLHIMVYLGDNSWIEADPIAMKVVKETTPSRSPWFQTHVKVVRWTMLGNLLLSPIHREVTALLTHDLEFILLRLKRFQRLNLRLKGLVGECGQHRVLPF